MRKTRIKWRINWKLIRKRQGNDHNDIHNSIPAPNINSHTFFELLRSQIEVLDIFIELKITKITIYTARGLSSRIWDLIAIEGADQVWPL